MPPDRSPAGRDQKAQRFKGQTQRESLRKCVYVCATYRAISGVDSVVSLSVLCILKLPIDETLGGHPQCHIIDVFRRLEMENNTTCSCLTTERWCWKIFMSTCHDFSECQDYVNDRLSRRKCVRNSRNRWPAPPPGPPLSDGVRTSG